MCLVLPHSSIPLGLPRVIETPPMPSLTRRALLGAMLAVPSLAMAGSPLSFSPAAGEATDTNALRSVDTDIPLLKTGEIPADFWEQPRKLWLKRASSGEEINEVYFENGQIRAEGYWKICAILRDTHQNVMTMMDINLLNVLRGITGFYEAWNWNRPLIVNSGLRTEKTNKSLLSEGAVKNSLHLYGRAADVWMEGINSRDIGILAAYFQRGGVGFYRQKNFVHVDTGRVRTWAG